MVPVAGGVIRLLPAHVIFHSLRAISSSAPPPHSRLHLILLHVFLRLYLVSSIHRSRLNFFLHPPPPPPPLFSTLFLLLPPPCPSCVIIRCCIHTCCIEIQLTTLLSLLWKVTKVLQAPVSVFPLATDGKWAGSHAQTPLIYTSNSNTQIIHTVHRKKKKKRERNSASE